MVFARQGVLVGEPVGPVPVDPVPVPLHVVLAPTEPVQLMTEDDARLVKHASPARASCIVFMVFRISLTPSCLHYCPLWKPREAHIL